MSTSPTIVRVIKSKKIRWPRNAALMGQMMNAYKILVENLKGRDHSKDMDVDGGIILEWILRK
jgi:hypothetical protein